MTKEKIGSDVLETEPPKTKYDKRKSELLEQAKKEVEKKKKLEEEEKLSKISVPGEKPPEMSEEEWQELQMRARLTGKLLEEEKDVHVKEHYRSKPKKKEQKEESFFNFP
jgi:hypothetical protein